MTDTVVRDADRSAFETQGFVRIPGRLSDSALAQLRQSVLMAFGGCVPGVRGDAWQYSGYLQALTTAESLLQFGQGLYGAKLRPHRTETFAVSPEMPYHAAGMWLASLEPPARTCCIWTAFEDMTPDNGPLVLFPGTHAMGLLSMRELGGVGVEFMDLYYQATLKRVELRTPTYVYLRRGESCLLHAHLIHGTARRRNPNSSLMCHRTWYAVDDAQIYYVPVNSDMPAGQLQRVVFPTPAPDNVVVELAATPETTHECQNLDTGDAQ